MKITDTWDEKHGRTISIDGELIKEVQSKYQNIKVYDKNPLVNYCNSMV